MKEHDELVISSLSGLKELPNFQSTVSLWKQLVAIRTFLDDFTGVEIKDWGGTAPF